MSDVNFEVIEKNVIESIDILWDHLTALPLIRNKVDNIEVIRTIEAVLHLLTAPGMPKSPNMDEQYKIRVPIVTHVTGLRVKPIARVWGN